MTYILIISELGVQVFGAEEVFSRSETDIDIAESEYEIHLRIVDDVTVFVLYRSVHGYGKLESIVDVVEFEGDVAQFVEFESEQCLQQRFHYAGRKFDTDGTFSEGNTFGDFTPVDIVEYASSGAFVGKFRNGSVGADYFVTSVASYQFEEQVCKIDTQEIKSDFRSKQ